MIRKLNLKKYNACDPAVEWFKTQNSNSEAWENCHRGDWMLWISHRLGAFKKTLILTKAYCARTVYHLMQDERSREAIIVSINYGRGLATDKELKAAAIAAAIAADAATDAAAYVGVYAARAAAIAAYAYAGAYASAYAAAHAADAYAYANAADYIKNQKKTADICRKYLTKELQQLGYLD